MTIHWIFDVDDTLYQLKKRKPHFDYRDIRHDPYLRNLINGLPGTKHIFSNSMMVHSKRIVNKQGINKIFSPHRIYTRDKMGVIKPNKYSYSYVMNKVKPKNNDYLVFFDDRDENLEMAKKHGWVTVSINPKPKNHLSFVDLSFPNIHRALNFFSSVKNRRRM